MGHALFIAESFGGWDGDGVAAGQQAGEQCAESEQRGGCEQTVCAKAALHPVGEDGARKAVKGKTDDNARGRADQRDARSDPQHVRTRRAERQADAELCSALGDAVSDDAEDADQRINAATDQCGDRSMRRQINAATGYLLQSFRATLRRPE
jgi:hypothetical protein